MNWRKHNVKETDCNTDECPPGKSLFILFVFVVNVYSFADIKIIIFVAFIFISLFQLCALAAPHAMERATGIIKWSVLMVQLRIAT